MAIKSPGCDSACHSGAELYLIFVLNIKACCKKHKSPDLSVKCHQEIKNYLSLQNLFLDTILV